MAVATRAQIETRRARPGLGALRWALRGAGLLGAAAACLVTPERVAEHLRAGESLSAIGCESLLAYRVLSGALGVALVALAESLPRLSRRRDALRETLGVGVPGAVVAACIGLKAALGPQHVGYADLVVEDGAVEYATALAYLVAGALACGVVRGLRRGRERALALAWSALAFALLLVACEEISWGQRLLGLPTPALFAGNVQGELTLHNLPLIQSGLHAAYVAVGCFGALGWALVGERGAARTRTLALPGRSLALCFLPVALVYALLELTPARFVGPDRLRFGFVSPLDQEPAELLLALGFLFFALQALARVRARPGAPG
jgi:hypothetical protein